MFPYITSNANPFLCQESRIQPVNDNGNVTNDTSGDNSVIDVWWAHLDHALYIKC